MPKRLTKKQQEEAYAADCAAHEPGPIRGKVQRYSDEAVEELWRRAEHVHEGDPFSVGTTFKLVYPALSHSIPAHSDVFYCDGFEVALHLLATVDYWRKKAEEEPAP